MSRKDYELIAACLANAPQGADPEADRASVALAFALEMELDNPRFDRERFLTACGIEPDRR
jgi:hypothetical protein